MEISGECKLKVDIQCNILNICPRNLAPQKPLNILPIAPARCVATGQPVGQLLRIATHFGAELLQRQSVDLFVPCQSFNDIVRTGDGIIPEEGDDLGDEPEIDGPPMLPVPDGGGGHADLGRDILLKHSEFETAPAQVVAEGDRFLSELGK